MTKISSKIINSFNKIGIINSDSLELYSKRVRDRDDIEVYKCKHSGLILLSRTDHIEKYYYSKKTSEEGYTFVDDIKITSADLEDNKRRANQFKKNILGKKWLDYGTGNAQLIELLKDKAEYAIGLELNSKYRKAALKSGLKIFDDLSMIENDSIDVITLFHVFEHLVFPVEILKELRSKLVSGGCLILEVPHAHDILLETLCCEAFKDFTLWSEHLVLHNKESLKKILEYTDFKSIDIDGYQRYPLSNHLYWLRYGRPGGHEKWNHLNDQKLSDAYSSFLKKNNLTDTLIATCIK